MVDGRAPLLFPIVGKLPDTANFDGEPFPMRQHGFARNKPFSVVGESVSECTFALAADDETRRQFPFDFVLKVTSIVNEAVLRPRAIVLNKSMGDADFVRLSPSLSLAPTLQWIAL